MLGFAGLAAFAVGLFVWIIRTGNVRAENPKPPEPKGPLSIKPQFGFGAPPAAPVQTPTKITGPQVPRVTFELARRPSEPRQLQWEDRIAVELGAKVYYCRVAGISYPNDDRTSRQAELKRCCERDPVKLFRQPHNRFGATAIAVLAPSGRQLGFIPKETSAWLSESLDRGDEWRAFIVSIAEAGWSDTGRRLYGAQLALLKCGVVPPDPES